MSQEEGKQEQPVVLSKAQEAERARMEKEMRKRAAMDLADYKKRLRENNELKRLQVEELELNISFYENKKKWMDLAPAMEELEAREKAIIAEERKKQQKMLEEQHKMAEEAKKEEAKNNKPEIILPKTGKPRE